MAFSANTMAEQQQLFVSNARRRDASMMTGMTNK
jgi:hypothetical protein